MLTQFKEKARLPIRREGIPLLARLLEHGTLDDLREDEFARFAAYTEANIVLCYRNDVGRYEVHPLVREHVRERAAQAAAAAS